MHMDVLSVGGKDYVKASVIARDLGYTADYVGQLCRSRKVNAKLVGRSWYVDRNSIHLHKTHRYRSTQTKSLQTLKETLEIEHTKDTGSPVPIHAVSTQQVRIKTPAYISYSTDPADLIPEVSKTPKTKLSIGLADAKEVKIRDKSEQYRFEASELPIIQFSGKLNVSDIEDEVVSAEGDPRHIHPRWFREKGKKAKNLAISSIPVHILSQTQKTRITHDEAKKVKNIEQTTKTTEIVENSTTVYSRITILSAAVSACAIVLLLLGAETHVVVSDGSVSTSYAFALENLSASSYAAAENFMSTLHLVEFSTNFFFF